MADLQRWNNSNINFLKRKKKKKSETGERCEYSSNFQKDENGR